MTIHGSKSELKRLRYLENRAKDVSSLPDTITFGLTFEISILETKHSYLSRDTNISSIIVRKGLKIYIWSQTREEARIADVSIGPGGHLMAIES